MLFEGEMGVVIVFELYVVMLFCIVESDGWVVLVGMVYF